MEYESSYYRQLRKKITATGVMIKKNRMLEADKDENDEKIDGIS